MKYDKPKGLSQFRKLIPALYCCVLIAMTLIIIFNIVLKDRPGADYGLNDFTSMDKGWLTEAGDEFVISQVDDLRSEDSDTVSIYHKLPDSIEKDESIVFRSKNCAVTVLIEGKQVYQTDIADAPFYNHSPGTRWNIVDISKEDGGKTVELQVKQAYQDGRAKVDNFYYGDRATIVLQQIDAKVGGFVISLLILFVAAVFFAAWLVLNWKRVPKDNSLLWLAVFAAIAACWSLLETNLFQFFSSNLRLIQVVDNMMLVLGGMPLYLYIDSVYQVFRLRIVRILCGLNMAYILFATLSQFMGWWDYHQTLNGAVATYGIVVVVFFIGLFKQNKKIRTYPGKNERLTFFMQQAGILMLGLGVLGDLLCYLFTDVLDRAFVIRIGLLFFILCFGAGNILQMIQLVKKGMEAEIISQLAYSDGLTKTGNRTAYIEHLQRLQKEAGDQPVALIIFDINNLKKINDTLGHKTGDDLILCCAQLVQESFGPQWSIFRIGGDEFVAITHGGDVHAAYQQASENFAQAILHCNESEERDYRVAVAHGVAFGEKITAQSIELIEKEADSKMYQDKYRLKFSADQPSE